eukprot:364280-Chlamydomonas_euryale.AAC.16
MANPELNRHGSRAHPARVQSSSSADAELIQRGSRAHACMRSQADGTTLATCDASKLGAADKRAVPAIVLLLQYKRLHVELQALLTPPAQQRPPPPQQQQRRRQRRQQPTVSFSRDGADDAGVACAPLAVFRPRVAGGFGAPEGGFSAPEGGFGAPEGGLGEPQTGSGSGDIARRGSIAERLQAEPLPLPGSAVAHVVLSLLPRFFEDADAVPKASPCAAARTLACSSAGCPADNASRPTTPSDAELEAVSADGYGGIGDAAMELLTWLAAEADRQLLAGSATAPPGHSTAGVPRWRSGGEPAARVGVPASLDDVRDDVFAIVRPTGWQLEMPSPAGTRGAGCERAGSKAVPCDGRVGHAHRRVAAAHIHMPPRRGVGCSSAGWMRCLNTASGRVSGPSVALSQRGGMLRHPAYALTVL